jgi:hypothetical protein
VIVTSLHAFHVSVQKSAVELVGGDDCTRLLLQRNGKFLDFEYKWKA